MIQSFKDKETEKIFEGRHSKRLPGEIHKRVLRKLILLNQATTLEHLKNFPANHLESLMGDRQGQYSIRNNQQWRLCFKWETGHAHEVEITDYDQENRMSSEWIELDHIGTIIQEELLAVHAGRWNRKK